jgi:mxaJ protein
VGYRRYALIMFAAIGVLICTPTADARTLKVCADPNNMPFSNQARQGFENRIIELVAHDLGAEVDYVWMAQRRGYVRNGLNAGRCDVIPGVAASLDMVAVTRPYYRSTYVFVTRPDEEPLRSLDDPRLHQLRIGVQMIGDDFSNTPPAHALTRRGIVGNVRGFMIYGDYATAAPQAPIIDAVAHRDIDVALAWGPLAGYFAAADHLNVAPVEPWLDPPDLPMVFDISMGLRRSDADLRLEIDHLLTVEAPVIRQILADYHVPEPEAQ